MPTVLYDQDGAIVTLTLNRPDQMNSYNFELYTELREAIKKADKDTSVRVIVVTGAGRAFCAGADLDLGFKGKEFVDNDQFLDGVSRDTGGMLNLDIFDADTPIIAAVNGHAAGIGATMLLPMDIKIVSSKAKICFPFARRGIVYDGAASFFLPRIVGLSKAQEWILTGKVIMADEALSAGLINEVVEPNKVLERTMEIARDIAVNVSPQSAARNKQLTRASLYGDDSYPTPGMSAHMKESRFLNEAFESDDCKEGVASFFEKRPPQFKDRKPQ